ncbi:MAG: hypothetical protein JXB23_17280 [Candidatus Aminicenantes bacterium]|nr:hypothetical protein [Candidatus Aminicenantes bacterium]
MNVSWVPVHSGLSRFFPTDRPFSEIEAVFSLQLNLYQGKAVSVVGLSKSWRWTRKRTRLFLERIGAMVDYPDRTSKKQNQRGQIRGQILEKEGPDKGQIMLIDFNVLDAKRARKGADNEKLGARSRATISNNIHSEKNKQTSSSKIDEGSEPYRLAQLLLSLIRNQSPQFKQPDLKKWATHIDRAIRIDGRTPSELERVIRWCQNDHFWRSNILSTNKLREKFDQLAIKMNSHNKNDRYNGIDEWLRIKEMQHE